MRFEPNAARSMWKKRNTKLDINNVEQNLTKVLNAKLVTGRTALKREATQMICDAVFTVCFNSVQGREAA